jgi:hypothetical protein
MGMGCSPDDCFTPSIGRMKCRPGGIPQRDAAQARHALESRVTTGSTI